MRIGKEVRRAASRAYGRFVEIARDRKETFSTKKPAIGDLRKPTCAQRLRKVATTRLQGIGMINGPVALAATSFIKADEHGYSLQKRGFAGAIFADDDGNRPIEIQFKIVAQKRQAEWIGCGLGDTQGIEPDAFQIR